MKLSRLTEHYSNEIAPKDTQMRIEVTFRGHESFSLYFVDLEEETFSQHHFRDLAQHLI